MNPNQPRKYFDVAAPGQAAPSATSRPVLPNKSPQLHDPMFNETPAATPAAQPKMAAQPESLPAPETPAAEPQPATPIDAEALLIQAGHWEPPKASDGKGRKLALIAMVVVLVALCAASYWFVSSM
jgi:hypothetical protein